MKLGAFEKALKVPLFTELYGYGPFKGRRNQGIHDPLFCRALSFNDGNRRQMIIGTDAVVSDDFESRVLRARISDELKILPQAIMFTATHTHSGPSMSFGIGWGERDEKYLAIWRETVMEVARTAITNEEEVTAYPGKAVLPCKVGYNRANPETDVTDPEIRFVKFVRKDGSVKVLLHNHAMHGVVYGPKQMRVSADWMGEANRRIKAEKLADMPFFMLGCAGDINVIWKGYTDPAVRDQLLAKIGDVYIGALKEALPTAVTPMDLEPFGAELKTFEMPTEPITAEKLRADAKIIESIENMGFLHDRMLEMAMLIDRGDDLRVLKDLQTLKMGGLQVYAFPGEPFVKLGMDLMSRSKAQFPIPASVANGNGRYFPDKETFAKNPGIVVKEHWGEYGFYEVNGGVGRYMPRYKSNISDFIVDKLLGLL